jgi:CIC family chloride channel protein
MRRGLATVYQWLEPQWKNSLLVNPCGFCEVKRVQTGLKKLEQFLTGIRAFLHRHWLKALRIREKLRFSEETFHLVLAACVGVCGGLINLGFHLCIELSQKLFLGRTGEPADLAAHSTTWVRLLVPTIGGLAAGMVLYWGLRLVGKQGSSNILEVVATSDGRLPFRTAIVQAVSSLMSIGCGASIGREGAITELSAMVGSKLGQVARWQPYRLRLLTATGAAAGISAAYNAPITGAVFAALIVVGNFSMSVFAPLVVSSVAACLVSRSFFGLQPLYVVPSFDFTSLAKLPWFVVLGILTGVMGSVFMMMLDESKDAFKKIPGPIFIRLMIGGLIVGIITLGFPGVWGNGYGIASQILHGKFLELPYPLLFLVGLYFAKLIATVATVGSGAVGGVFTPTLFLGAGMGAIVGTTLHKIGQATGLPTGAFALVGMGSMLAATTRSPLLAMIMVFELSLNYSIMPPLMIACVISTVVSRRLHAESIYTEPLRKKGLVLDRENTRSGTATAQTIGELMHAPVPPVREIATLREIAERFLTSPNNFLPVVDSKFQLIGVVALQDLKEHLNAGEEMCAVIAYDVMRPPPVTVTPSQLLLDTLPIMLASEQRNVPVVNSRTENRLVGAVLRAEVLGLLSEAIASRGDQAKT